MAAKVTKVVVLGVHVGRYGGNVQNCVVVWVLRQYALKMVNIKWAAPPRMRSLSDSMLGQSLRPLAMTVTTICRLPESSTPSVTGLRPSVAFPPTLLSLAYSSSVSWYGVFMYSCVLFYAVCTSPLVRV